MLVYFFKISLCHAKIEKISEKIFVMINKDGGGHRAHGGIPQSPSTRENPGSGYISDLQIKIFFHICGKHFDGLSKSTFLRRDEFSDEFFHNSWT